MLDKRLKKSENLKERSKEKGETSYIQYFDYFFFFSPLGGKKKKK